MCVYRLHYGANPYILHRQTCTVNVYGGSTNRKSCLNDWALHLSLVSTVSTSARWTHAPFILASLSAGVRGRRCVFEVVFRQACQAQLPRLPRQRLWELRHVFSLDTSLSNPRSTAWSAGSVSQPSRTWKDEAARSRRRLCSNSWRDWRRTRPMGRGRPKTKLRISANSCLAPDSVSHIFKISRASFICY